MKIYLSVALLSLTMSTAIQAEELISPLPLAKDARPKDIPWPSDAATAQYLAESTRFSALVGTHDFEALENETQRWANEVQSGKLPMDGYIRRLETLSEKAIKSTLPDFEAWVAAKPKSYAAIFSLGLAQVKVALQERGRGFANEITQEQWKGHAHYSQLAQKSFLASINLMDKPVPSYRQLARLWGNGSLKRSANINDSPDKQSLTAPNCKTLLNQKTITAETSPEPLYYYTCLAVRDAPDATIPLRPVIEMNSLRWGGNWNRSKDFLDQLEKTHAITDKVLKRARSEWYTTVAYDASGLLNDKRAAADAYMKSIEIWPVREDQEKKFAWAGEAYRAVADFDSEIRVYQKAVEFFPEKGYYWAMLGWAYERKGDMKNFMINMSKAALLGRIEAQNNVGYFYMVGQRGLPKNLYAARDWLTLAANQGFQHSKDKLPVVEQMIKEQEKTK